MQYSFVPCFWHVCPSHCWWACWRFLLALFPVSIPLASLCTVDSFEHTKWGLHASVKLQILPYCFASSLCQFTSCQLSLGTLYSVLTCRSQPCPTTEHRVCIHDIFNLHFLECQENWMLFSVSLPHGYHILWSGCSHLSHSSAPLCFWKTIW